MGAADWEVWEDVGASRGRPRAAGHSAPGRAGRGGTLPSRVGGLSERPPQGVQPEAGLERAPEGSTDQRGYPHSQQGSMTHSTSKGGTKRPGPLPG